MRIIAFIIVAVAIITGPLPEFSPLHAQTKSSPKKDKTESLKVGPVPKAVRQAFQLDNYYTRYTNAAGLPVVASKNVGDKAVAVAAETVAKMLSKRPDIVKALVDARVRVAVIGKNDQTTDLPEYVGLRSKADFWNKRARGLGATASALASSVGEENLLGLVGDRYRGESILVHEFAHTVHTMGLNKVDPRFEPRLRETFARANKKQLWAKTYASTDYLEYWAEGVQSYFDANMPVRKPDGIHNGIATRDALKQYDPDLYDLIDKTLKSPKWKWRLPQP